METPLAALISGIPFGWGDRLALGETMVLRTMSGGA